MIGLVCDVLCCIKALSAVADELCLTCDVAMMEQNLRKNAATDVLPCEYSIHTYRQRVHHSSFHNDHSNADAVNSSPLSNLAISDYT